MVKELEYFDLTKGEITVYLALLSLGQTTTGPLIKETGMQNSSVHYCLTSLVEKGFCSYVEKGKTKHYSPLNPQSLPQKMDEKIREVKKKKEEVKKIIPNLQQRYDQEKETPKATVYEGFKGLRNVLNNLRSRITSTDRYDVFVVESSVSPQENVKLLLEQNNKILHEKGVKHRMIAPTSMKEKMEDLYGNKIRKHTDLKFTNRETPIGTVITDDLIMTIVLQPEIKCFLIQDQNVARSYSRYFEETWDLSQY